MSGNNWNDNDGLRGRVKNLLGFCLVVMLLILLIMLTLDLTGVDVPFGVKAFLNGITTTLQVVATTLIFLVLPNRKNGE